MPRSGGGRSGGGGRSFGGGGRGGYPSRSYSTSRPSSPPPSHPAPTQSKGPSVMRQIAITGAGVAAGNLLAHAILSSARDSIPPGVECSDGNCSIPEDDPCRTELQNFIQCAYRATDMQQCDGFNTLLKECRRYSESYQR